MERWKENNREYYLQQKRDLGSRPEYRLRMREKYAAGREELRQAGILPRRMGRPRLYEGEEALEMQRQRARLASARYQTKIKISRLYQNNESTKSTDPSEESN